MIKQILICATILIIFTDSVASVRSNEQGYVPHYERPEEPKTTGEILSAIRELMRFSDHIAEPIQAYIIPSVDAHQSEYIAKRDRRLAYVSEFTGSNGLAIITEEKAGLWTDARYFLQAENQIDSNVWTLMKEGLPDTPTKEEWLKSILPVNSSIGTDPFLMSSTDYNKLANTLKLDGHELVSIEKNFVDLVWTDRPALKLTEIFPLEYKYTGRAIEDKISKIEEEIRAIGAKSIIITALDEIAWLLNLRASDIQNNPVFYSYVILSPKDVTLYVNKDRINNEILEHFHNEGVEIKIQEYDGIIDGIHDLVNQTDGKIIISNEASAAIYNVIPVDRMVQVYSPTALLKCIKTSNEAHGMREAHIRDGAALVRYLNWLEKNVDNGNITELSGSKKLKEFRSEQEESMGTSFTSISAFGSNSAIIHYSPTPETNERITRDNVYLIDSGGQYLDGTTDVTRTIHLGSPTDFQKECFTRVLKGYLSLGSAVFPKKAPGSYFDALGRKSLWDVGLDYGHGTGHGVGSFLGVHEYPPYFSSSSGSIPGALENMFSSIEPGFYQDGEFGVRIEDVVQIVPADVAHNFGGRGALKFYTVTLVPIQLKLINPKLLTDNEVKLLDEYHLKVREIVGEFLQNQRFLEDYEWLLEQTQNISVYYNLI